MYEFQHERERREKRRKLLFLSFNSLFALTLIVEMKDFWLGDTSGLRLMLVPLVWFIVLYFGIRRKSWAEWLIKLTVLVNIAFLLILFIITMIEWIV